MEHLTIIHLQKRLLNRKIYNEDRTTMRKKTIGLNPLEEYLSAPKNTPTEKTKKEEVVKKPVQAKKHLIEEAVEVDGQGQLAIKGTQVPEEPGARPTKQRITLHISADRVDRVKNAVDWEPGLTVAGFAEDAVLREIDELEAKRGAAFPQRKHHRLRGGRPVS